MTRKVTCMVGLVLTVAVGLLAAGSPGHKPSPVLGVSIAGSEFGWEKPGFCNQNPGRFGRDYTYNSVATYSYFASRGIQRFRIPIRWERIQPVLGEPLQADEVRRLRIAVNWAKMNGGQVILDLHNFGQYFAPNTRGPVAWGIDQQRHDQVLVTSAHFVDLWRRLARLFKDESAIFGFGLMNEPHALAITAWHDLSRQAARAIRAEGAKQTILVSGGDWAGSQHFAEVNGSPWIDRELGPILYEAHCYLDADASGRYRSTYQEELAADPHLRSRPHQRLAPFIAWCNQHGVRGFLGEFGVPRDDPNWHEMLVTLVSDMRQSNLEGCLWAGGEWWGQHPLSVQPSRNFSRDASPLAAIR